MKNKIETSIVIRTHNHEKLLKRILKKIKEQERFEDYEVIIIDSSSTDGTKELAFREGCEVFSIRPEKFSHAYTFNLGADKAKGEFIFYVSVDVIPKNNLWAYNLIKHFKDKKVAGVFGKQEPIKGFNTIEEFKIKRMFPDKERSVALFSNASGVIRKDVWENEKYNEKFPFQYVGGEDQIWAKAIKKKGFEIIYEIESIVYHSHRYSMITRIKDSYQNGLNEKEMNEWKKGINLLNYSKIELAYYLLKKSKFKELIWDLIIGGILLRIARLIGKLNRKNK